jgi:hypothetical protein
MNAAALDSALRRKFGRTGPRGALRAMGFDARTTDEILEENDMPSHDRRRARDADDPIIDAESAMALIEQVCEDLPEPEQEELCDMLEERLLRDEPGTAQDRKRRRAQDRRAAPGRVGGRLGKDEPEPFPGRPNPGGWQDPLSAAAQDRVASRRALRGAMDSSGVKSFDELFPGAKRTNIASGTGRLTPIL